MFSIISSFSNSMPWVNNSLGIGFGIEILTVKLSILSTSETWVSISVKLGSNWMNSYHISSQ